MSAPNTNTETQVKRHKGPLWGMALVGLFVAGMFLALAAWVADDGGVPEGAETQIDGRTGAVVEE